MAASVAALAVTMTPASAADLPADRCAAAAQDFVESLPATARAQLAWPFTESLRNQWSYRTGGELRQQGIRTGELDDAQRHLAHALMQCGLSSQGYLKAAGIMRIDDLVRDRAGEIVMNDGRLPIEIGQEFFWFTVFGAPGERDPWGFQVEGHHLVLNMTLAGGRVAVTPAFWGAWPATVEEGPMAGFRALPAEEDRAFALMASLDATARRRAVLSATLPPGIFTGPDRNAALVRYEGVPASALAPAARRSLLGLVAEYVGNFDTSIAGPWMRQIEADGLDRLHFAWMGPTRRGEAVYYRIHGPSILIEFDHARNIRVRELPPDPNHIHTIVRRPGDDLGVDLLANHYRTSPDH